MTDELVPTTPQSLAEVSTASVSAQAMASVQARYAIAQARPRDMDAARVRLLGECKRPRFAEVAMWRRPVGRQSITGPSIRFIETAIRCMGNILVESPCIYDSPEKRLVRVQVTDIEANSTYSKDLTISKTVERSHLKQGQPSISQRVNSYGKTVYTVEATDDEVAVKEAAMVSKAIRVLGQRLVPGDLVDDAIDAITATLEDRNAKDPGAAKKALVDAFAGIGIRPDALVGFLGHGLDGVTPKELAELREMYETIKSGETKWSDYIDAAEDEPEKKTKSSRTADVLKERREKSEPGADG